jgi:Flp pilus assembly protein TadG
LVEFAIILPLILLLIIGIIEFGLIMNSYISIQHASREGARVGAVGGTDLAIQSAITDISPNLDTDKLEITISPTEGIRERGDALTVNVKYNYTVTLPIISNIVGNDITLDTETIMRVE